MKPIRVQRKRTKGWKMPENTVSVTRPGKWGNPFKAGDKVPDTWIEKLDHSDTFLFMKFNCGYVETLEDSIYLFRLYVLPTIDLSDLKGKNLACFCPLDKPCHADVLLSAAN